MKTDQFERNKNSNAKAVVDKLNDIDNMNNAQLKEHVKLLTRLVGYIYGHIDDVAEGITPKKPRA